jgi:hypothetical protein
MSIVEVCRNQILNEVGGKTAYRRNASQVKDIMNKRLNEIFEKVLNKKYEGELSDYIDTLIGRIT